MNKLENASNNLKEILFAIADGKEVQFYSREDSMWFDYRHGYKNVFHRSMIHCEWRIKPIDFDKSLKEWEDSISKDNEIPTPTPRCSFKAGWQAAMDYK